MGVLLSFVPPMKGFILNRSNLLMIFRRSFGIVLKNLIRTDSDECQINGWSNILCRLPYMFLQYDGERPDMGRCNVFFTKLNNEEVLDIKVSDFAKKTMRSHKVINRKCIQRLVLVSTV